MKQSVENDKWPILASYFEREGTPVGEVEMTLTVQQQATHPTDQSCHSTLWRW